MFLSVFLTFTSIHNKCSLIISFMLCTFISFLSLCHNLITVFFVERVTVLPVTLFFSVLCNCTLIIHIRCTITFVMMVFSTHYLFNIYFNITLQLTTSSLKYINKSLKFKVWIVRRYLKPGTILYLQPGSSSMGI